MGRPTLAAGALAVGAAVAAIACADRPPKLDADVDKVFAEQYKPDSPGVSVAVSHKGVVVYERAFGMANLELRVPVTPATVFQAASISKQFTAMSIALLAHQGKLSLDDPVRKYLTEFPDYGAPLTIRHLLNHSSGLRDVFLLLELFAPDEGRGDQNERLLKMLARQRALNFQPGTESVYNNGAYAMLAVIVRRVSGQSLAAFAEANIFKPLGMTSTRFGDDPTVRSCRTARRPTTARTVPGGWLPMEELAALSATRAC